MRHQLIVTRPRGTDGSIRLHCSCTPGVRIDTGCRRVITLDQLNQAAHQHIEAAENAENGGAT